jgi:hypothetical protein
MIKKCAWRVVLVVALSVAVAMPARAESEGAAAIEIIAAIVVVGVVLVFLVPATIVHYSKKRTITGCVISEANGMTLTDERDKQIYALSGDTSGIKAGDRVKLQGKKERPKGTDKALLWKATKVTKDFGACQP